MWLVAAVTFFGLFWVFRMIKMNQIIVPQIIKWLFFGLLLLGVCIFILLEGFIMSKITSVPPNNCDYIIVLGAQIKGDKVSNALKQRLDAAYEYILNNPDTKVIVSGGKGVGEDVSEAFAMKEYLVSKGIDGKKILMEDKSYNTDQNMKFSVKFIDDKEASIGIVTSNFHVYRSLKLARAQGLTNVSGLASPCKSVLFLNYLVRESVGIAKDTMMGNFK